MNENSVLPEMGILFLALADKTRLRILNLLRGGDEICVHYFTETLGESQPKVSRHLAYLRNAGVVSARRDGKWINYKIETPKNSFAARLLDETLEWLETQTEMRADYEKLAALGVFSETALPGEETSAPNTFVSADIKENRTGELPIYLL